MVRDQPLDRKPDNLFLDYLEREIEAQRIPASVAESRAVPLARLLGLDDAIPRRRAAVQ